MLHELIYTSNTVPDQRPSVLTEILLQSRVNNAALQVTGALLHDRGEFAQLIEGDAETILRLWEKIRCDHRHRDARLAHFGFIEKRSFSDWNMAFSAMDQLSAVASQRIAEIVRKHSLGQAISQYSHFGHRVFRIIRETLPKASLYSGSAER